MYYYFSSAFPAAIKFNGIYYGVISQTVKSINLDGSLTLVEICPLVPNERQINFIPDSEFLASPPDGILITDMRGGYLIKVEKNYRVEEFSIINQQKFSDLVVTVFTENGLKISIETQNNFFADVINFSARSAEVKRFSLSNEQFIAVFLEGEDNLLLVYHIDSQIEKVFSRNVSGYSVDGGFYTTEKFKDVAKHVVHSEWDYNKEIFQKNTSVERSESFIISELTDKILPYAFLEEILVGGNPSDFLCDDLKEHANKLKDYLGEYIGVIPPPIFRKPTEVGIVFAVGKNKYKVDYCEFEIVNGKIANVKKSEN